jgi:hypothetical protein
MNDLSPAASFKQAVCPQQTETLLLDADVLYWIKGEFPDWQGHINDLLRFFMDTSQNREREFAPGAFEPGEMAEPDQSPALNSGPT